MTVHPPEYCAFARRIIRAYVRRAADLDPADLAEMIGLRAELDRAIDQAAAMVKASGYSWAEIGSATGTTRQAAQQRWGRLATTMAGPSGVNAPLTPDGVAATALAS